MSNSTDTVKKTDQEAWLSIGDAAEFLGLSRDTLRRWEKVGKIKVYRSPTNRRIYKQSDLDDVYKARQSGVPIVAKKSVIAPEVTEVSNDPVVETEDMKKFDTPVNQIFHPLSPSESNLEEATSDPDTKPEVEVDAEIEKETVIVPEPATIPQRPVLEQVPPTPVAPSVPNITAASVVKPMQVAQPITQTPEVPQQVLASSPTSVAPLPTTPLVSDQFEKNNPVAKADSEESKSTKVLKIFAIVLALLLVFLGIGITVMVFV